MESLSRIGLAQLKPSCRKYRLSKLGVRDTSNSYDQYKKNIISTLGKPEDSEAKRVQLDHVSQFLRDEASEFASRVLELVCKAWSDFTPHAQLSIAIQDIVTGLRDATSKDAIRQQQALHELSWPEVIKMAQG